MSGRTSSRPLRVLHVIGGLELGGAETLLYRLITNASPGVSHEVICLGDRDWYSPRLEQRGVVVHHLNMSSASTVPGGIGPLRKLFRESDPNVIQSWMYFANFMSGLLGRGAGVPLVWGIHATSVERSGLASRLCAYAGGATARWFPDFIVNCSNRSAEVHARLGYSAARHAVVPNGYDPSVFYPDDEEKSSARQSLGFDADAFVVGSISRWHPDKDVGSLLQAVAIVRERGVDASCILVGRGLVESNAVLQQEIERLKLDRNVRSLGLREDVSGIVRAFDLHVLPSLTEAFPNVIAESMLSGVPNIATDVGDSAEMIGGTGWVVEPADPHALATAIGKAHEEWSERDQPWRKRRIEARQRIVDRYTLERMIERYEAIWRELAFGDR